MTFGEKRRAIRELRTVLATLRLAMRTRGRTGIAGVSLSVERDVFDRVYWALGRVKAWYAVEQRYVRVDSRFVETADPREHVLVAGCKVFREAECRQP